MIRFMFLRLQAVQDVIPCRAPLCAGHPANLTSHLPGKGGDAPEQPCADRNCDQRGTSQCEAQNVKGGRIDVRDIISTDQRETQKK
jgi:hypothetical protein